MYWVRIDNRLIHGQIIETWLPFTGVEELVVANDELATDALRQEIMAMAIPGNVRLSFTSIKGVALFVAEHSAGGQPPNALVLFATCPDARRAFESGLRFTELNIGNLHYGPGKKQIMAHVALSEEDESCLQDFARHGVHLDYRCVPNDPIGARGRS
jgi:mannose/fructose/N-acetylgalactosamine-specific phosphotransferase system component IIB